MCKDWNGFVAGHLYESERCRAWLRRKELAHRMVHGKIRFTDFDKTEIDMERPLAYITGQLKVETVPIGLSQMTALRSRLVQDKNPRTY